MDVKTDVKPFQFFTTSYLTCVEHERATTLNELIRCLETAQDGSIFFHTFRTLGRHHFLMEGFSNDFADWVQSGLNQSELAEELAAVDVRDYATIGDLRQALLRIVREYSASHAREAERPAFHPLHFRSAITVELPLPFDAHTLAGFRAGVVRLSNASFYYHLISSRLRLQLQTNDFSRWFASELGLEKLAQETDKIDIYTNTLDTARAELVKLVDREIGR